MKQDSKNRFMGYYNLYVELQTRPKWKTSAAAGMPFVIFFIALPYLVAATAHVALRAFEISTIDPYLLGLVAVGVNAVYFVTCALFKKHRKKPDK